MDRTGRLGGSAVIDDDAYHESLARLSLHLATRRPTQPLPDLEIPPPQRFRMSWPFVLLFAIAGAAAVGYPSYKWLVRPAPVMAAIVVAPVPSPPPAPPAKVEPSNPVNLATAIPAPPPPEPPVTLPEPTDTAAPQPEAALSKAEIIEIQKRLASLGLNPGPIDGVAGTRTVASVRTYEAQVGRPVTGKIDRSLLTLLR
jgi:hypothetical protein